MNKPDTIPWQAGQKAVINRQTIVTIDRVTAAGHAKVGDDLYDARSGRRRGCRLLHSMQLEILTPHIEAEMALVERGRAVANALNEILKDADRWGRTNLSSWGRRVPDSADIEKAENLVAFINETIGEVQP